MITNTRAAYSCQKTLKSRIRSRRNAFCEKGLLGNIVASLAASDTRRSTFCNCPAGSSTEDDLFLRADEKNRRCVCKSRRTVRCGSLEFATCAHIVSGKHLLNGDSSYPVVGAAFVLVAQQYGHHLLFFLLCLADR